MDYDGAGIRQRGMTEGSSSGAPDVDGDTLWQMNLRQGEPMEVGPYPERPGEPECAYYIRTGLCRFGMACRFNHPPNRKLVVANARTKGGYPERVGQPECQYFMKTGTCKFGATCKFDHPKDKARVAGRVPLNTSGYPLRPNEKECAYYLRTGQCKFGNICKFHHPQAPNTTISLRGSPVYSSVHSPTSPSHQTFSGAVPNWPLSRTFIQNPQWQGTSSYGSVILPQGLVQVSGWNAYPGQIASVSSSEGQQQSPGATPMQYHSTLRQGETHAVSQGGFPSYGSGSLSVGLYTLLRGNVFPERPEQPECQFYMKTGDCKFGAACRFHHPRERYIPAPNCVLSPLGLPLRPGEPICIFYSRYGICKFGPNCKFDHPMGPFAYGLSASPATTASGDSTLVWRLMGTSGPLSLALAPEGSVAEAGLAKSRQLSLPQPLQTATSEDGIDAEGSNRVGRASSFS